jgi:hypothetical protein
MKQEFVENVHYYIHEGAIVMTEKYHIDRGFCCGNNCKHCPYTKPTKKGNLEIREDFLHLKKE